MSSLIHVRIIAVSKFLPSGILEDHQLAVLSIIFYRSDVDNMSAGARKIPVLELFFGKSLDLSKGFEGEFEVFKIAGFTPGEGIVGDAEGDVVVSHDGDLFV